ncbi:hypothetical protein [Bosea vaviloviae]|uniref:Uncharacterized protein n=1 Tax=Bosea vaviloviae TaxID=1526658 RepID=A0A1D7TW04_9HYPH|nr:hypothetical protein [Bosea vaviloviae]AOO79302.1 hypothetical protein BHK69_01235 [Bosea vaviloviae]
MKHLPASDFIPSFDIEEISPPNIAAESAANEHAAVELPPFLLKLPREPAPDLDQIFENGRQAGLTEGRAEAERQITALRQEAAEALAGERRNWAGDVAMRLEAELPKALEALGETLSDTVGRLLRPFLEAELRDAASRALIEQIAPLLAGSDGSLIRISGPARLLATLRSVFPEGRAVEFAESDAVEVSIVTQDTIIETRIEAWVARLEGKGPDRRRRRSEALGPETNRNA